MIEENPTSIVIAHVTYSWPEAEVVCCMLNALGVPAILADRNTVALLWSQSIALGGFRILIFAKDSADANAILSEFKSSPSTELLPESNAFWREPRKNFLWLLFGFMFGICCLAWVRKRRC